MSSPFFFGGSIPWEAAAEGVRRQILGHGPDIMMVRVEFDAGAVGVLHSHPHRQVGYIAAGTFEVTVDGHTTILAEGDCFYVAADQIHGVVARDAGVLLDVFTPARTDFIATSAPTTGG